MAVQLLRGGEGVVPSGDQSFLTPHAQKAALVFLAGFELHIAPSMVAFHLAHSIRTASVHMQFGLVNRRCYG